MADSHDFPIDLDKTPDYYTQTSTTAGEMWMTSGKLTRLEAKAEQHGCRKCNGAVYLRIWKVARNAPMKSFGELEEAGFAQMIDTRRPW